MNEYPTANPHAWEPFPPSRGNSPLCRPRAARWAAAVLAALALCVPVAASAQDTTGPEGAEGSAEPTESGGLLGGILEGLSIRAAGDCATVSRGDTTLEAGDCEGSSGGFGGQQSPANPQPTGTTGAAPPDPEEPTTPVESTTAEPTEGTAPPATTEPTGSTEPTGNAEPTGSTAPVQAPPPSEPAAGTGECPTAPPAGALAATVGRVVDGDTLELSEEVDGTSTVRLIGADTPETVAPDQEPEPYGKEASDFTTKALEGQDVLLQPGEDDRDDYGRLLAYVWTNDGLFNETLLREGYAELLIIEPNSRYESCFEAAEGEAREAGKGLWGANDPEPAEPQTVSRPPADPTGAPAGDPPADPDEDAEGTNASVEPQGGRDGDDPDRGTTTASQPQETLEGLAGGQQYTAGDPDASNDPEAEPAAEPEEPQEPAPDPEAEPTEAPEPEPGEGPGDAPEPTERTGATSDPAETTEPDGFGLTTEDPVETVEKTEAEDPEEPSEATAYPEARPRVEAQVEPGISEPLVNTEPQLSYGVQAQGAEQIEVAPETAVAPATAEPALPVATSATGGTEQVLPVTGGERAAAVPGGLPAWALLLSLGAALLPVASLLRARQSGS